MCGIFGLVIKRGAKVRKYAIENMLIKLFKLSESRGKEAAGLAIRIDNRIYVYKVPVSASTMLRTSHYRRTISEIISKCYGRDTKKTQKPIVIIGHSRLVTNGVHTETNNNQPIIKGNCVAVHNGIIVNVDKLYSRYRDIKRKYSVDTEVMLDILQRCMATNSQIDNCITDTFREIEGSVSTGILFSNLDLLLLATNTGSLYSCYNKEEGIFSFASERYIIDSFIKYRTARIYFHSSTPSQIKPKKGLVISCGLRYINELDFSKKSRQEKHELGLEYIKGEIKDISPRKVSRQIKASLVDPNIKSREHISLFDVPSSKLNIKRCTRCLLPETHPGIRFDENGVCNHCKNYKPFKIKGREELEKLINKYKSRTGKPDCIVAFSGGRDSTYGLHYIKKELNLNPITFTYDWGMVTDLARRNQARICGKLGVEHILVSANISKKREYIKKNVEAWLKRPDLGMVPIFMAGDKQFFYYAHELRKQTGVKLVIFCAGSEYEITHFKQGFCGCSNFVEKTMTALSIKDKIKILMYYIKQYITNPSYINSSLLDTLFAFYSTYILKDDYIYLFNYIPWDEKEIEATIKDEYNWELANDTKTSWRIGDGTAPFYNYIYYTVAGFSEFDVMRSNQVRAGILTREEAFKLLDDDNKPRLESLQWYANIIGFDLKKAINIINSIPKLYEKK
ncbi:hypothetical protein JXB31_03450 [Candidatus Woesearchaeota archaeon]|nr:hypothetical protein [Candidatus Woesearchaeota archaeon]